MKILNFGSLNLDNVYQVPHFLQAGETMAALSEAVHPGGKGLNQSLALARAGADVYHAGVVGNGSELLTNLLKENGVHDDYLLHCDCTQGSTMIQVSPKGENCILLFGQSNHAITKGQVEETIAAFAPGDYLVLQNEVSCLPEMVEAGARRGLHVVLNPSPFDDSLRSLDYNQIRWIFINEVEGHQMTGEIAPDAILSALRAKYPALCVVLTLGSAGSICCTPEKTVHQPIFRVQAVDTTAAGDTPANASNPWLMPVLLVVMVAVFYFVMIRPQKKQEKQIAEMRDSLAVGDEVVTIGGIIGTVLIIKDDKIMIETGNDRTKLTILRSSVKTVLKDEDEAPAK